jgi:hypothetical protein
VGGLLCCPIGDNRRVFRGGRPSCLEVLAVVLVVFGLFGIVFGAALARDWLLVNQGVVAPGSDPVARVTGLVRRLLQNHDALEWVIAAAGGGLFAFGAGVLVGRLSAR